MSTTNTGRWYLSTEALLGVVSLVGSLAVAWLITSVSDGEVLLTGLVSEVSCELAPEKSLALGNNFRARISWIDIGPIEKIDLSNSVERHREFNLGKDPNSRVSLRIGSEDSPLWKMGPDLDTVKMGPQPLRNAEGQSLSIGFEMRPARLPHGGKVEIECFTETAVLTEVFLGTDVVVQTTENGPYRVTAVQHQMKSASDSVPVRQGSFLQATSGEAKPLVLGIYLLDKQKKEKDRCFEVWNSPLGIDTISVEMSSEGTVVVGTTKHELVAGQRVMMSNDEGILESLAFCPASGTLETQIRASGPSCLLVGGQDIIKRDWERFLTWFGSCCAGVFTFSLMLLRILRSYRLGPRVDGT